MELMSKKVFGEIEDRDILLHNSNYMSPFSKANAYFDSCYFELAGLELGFKPSAILYFKKSEINDFTAMLKKKSYFFEISDFAFNLNGAFTEKTYTNIKDNSSFSVYISKEKNICKRLKSLDRYHQLKLKEHSGKTGKEIFFEMGELLGYPRCCSEFIQSVHENPEFKDDLNLYGKVFDDEILYPMTALKKSEKTSFLLNNFVYHVPRLIGFFVCKYDCKNALLLAKKVLNFVKQKNSEDEYRKILVSLKTPIVFFSPREILHLINANKVNDKVYYSDCFYRDNGLSSEKDEKMQFLKESFLKFHRGNSFLISYDKIEIFKNNNLLFRIKKRHKYNGVFISFD